MVFESTKLAVLKDKILVVLSLLDLDHFDDFRVLDLLKQLNLRVLKLLDKAGSSLQLLTIDLFDAKDLARESIAHRVYLIVV